MFLIGVWDLDHDLDVVTVLWYTHIPNSGSLSWFCRCKAISCLLSPDLELWRMLEAGVWHLHLNLEMVTCLWVWCTLVLNLGSLSSFWRCKEHLCPLKSWLGALEDAGGSWLGLGIIFLIWIWLLIFDTPMYWILALYLDFEGTKNIPGLQKSDDIARSTPWPQLLTASELEQKDLLSVH